MYKPNQREKNFQQLQDKRSAERGHQSSVLLSLMSTVLELGPRSEKRMANQLTVKEK